MPGHRARVMAALAVAVLLAHGWLAARFADQMARLGEGAAAGLQRMQVAFVTALQVAEPAPAKAVAPPRSARRSAAAAAPAPAASAPEPEPEREPEPPPPPAAPVAEAVPEPQARVPLPEPAEPAQTGAPQVAASAAGTASAPLAQAFDWPLSTRLRYRLTGHYRGPVDGQAQVEWLRQGQRYQVHLEVSVGPPFAPLVARRMSSDGDLGDEGLAPRRYEEETRVAFANPRRVRMSFAAGTVTLANGTEVPRPAGVQDTASQFVHLTWLFTTQPARLVPGGAIELPLALPRRVEPWMYDVVAAETVHTPAGAFEAVHVKPRRVARPGGDLTAEAWFAPSLQHLPVRIVIRQDAETFVDLLLSQLPEQEAAPAR